MRSMMLILDNRCKDWRRGQVVLRYYCQSYYKHLLLLSLCIGVVSSPLSRECQSETRFPSNLSCPSAVCPFPTHHTVPQQSQTLHHPTLIPYNGLIPSRLSVHGKGKYKTPPPRQWSTGTLRISWQSTQSHSTDTMHSPRTLYSLLSRQSATMRWYVMLSYLHCSQCIAVPDLSLCVSHARAQVTSMKEVASLNQELTIEERNLLSVAYKNIIVSRIPSRLFSPLVIAVTACLWPPTGPLAGLPVFLFFGCRDAPLFGHAPSLLQISPVCTLVCCVRLVQGGEGKMQATRDRRHTHNLRRKSLGRKEPELTYHICS